MIVLKQDRVYEAANTFADTGSQFSIMTNDFAKSCKIKFNEADQHFDLLDMSGASLPMVGYADVEIKTFGNDKYGGTCMIVIDGVGHEIRLGRMDLCLLGIILANFPMKMSNLALYVERRAWTRSPAGWPDVAGHMGMSLPASRRRLRHQGETPDAGNQGLGETSQGKQVHSRKGR